LTGAMGGAPPAGPGGFGSGTLPLAPPAGAAPPLRTMVGMPAAVMNPFAGGAGPAGAPAAGSAMPARTMVGLPPPADVIAARAAAAAAAPSRNQPVDPRLGPNTAILGTPAIRIAPEPPSSTLLGVAMPGIAPLHESP